MGRPFADPPSVDQGTARIRAGEFGNAHQGLEKDLVAAVRVSECADIIGVGAQIIEHKIPEAVGDDDPVGTLFERRQCPEIGVIPGAQPFVEPFAEIARQAPDPIVPVGVVAPLHFLRQLGDVQFGLHVRELPRVARFEEIVYLPAGAQRQGVARENGDVAVAAVRGGPEQFEHAVDLAVFAPVHLAARVDETCQGTQRRKIPDVGFRIDMDENIRFGVLQQPA